MKLDISRDEGRRLGEALYDWSRTAEYDEDLWTLALWLQDDADKRATLVKLLRTGRDRTSEHVQYGGYSGSAVITSAVDRWTQELDRT